MSDVAQILGIAAPGSAAAGASSVASELDKLKPAGAPSASAAAAAMRAKNSKQKKLSGMQREVLELLESTHRVNHALYPGVSKLSLQQKWKQHKAPAVKWRRKPFRNPARADLAGESESSGLTLTHWMKAHVEPTDYVFARFNVACDVTQYTDDEYTHALAQHEDPLMKWTKDETDVLLQLCSRFDLRWIVIADQYNAHAVAKTASRSVEDIKYRYYEVTRLVGEYRDRVAAQQQQQESQRQASATAAAAIKLESASGTTTPVAAAATSTLETEAPTVVTGAVSTIAAAPPAPPSATLSTAPSTSTPNTSAHSDKYFTFNVAYEKQRKRQLELAFTRSIEEESEIRGLNDELKSVETQLKKVAMKVDGKKKKELADVPFELTRTLPPGVLLRSSLLALPQQKHALSSKLIKKMELVLDELGVPTRPMPTKATCELYDRVRKDIVGLLSLRKHVAAKQAEANVLRERYKSLTGTEFVPVSTPVRRSERRGDAVPGAAAIAASSGAAGSSSSASALGGPGSQGKALKHSEKAFRTATKRRGASPSVPSKRNKKVL